MFTSSISVLLLQNVLKIGSCLVSNLFSRTIAFPPPLRKISTFLLYDSRCKATGSKDERTKTNCVQQIIKFVSGQLVVLTISFNYCLEKLFIWMNRNNWPEESGCLPI